MCVCIAYDVVFSVLSGIVIVVSGYDEKGQILIESIVVQPLHVHERFGIQVKGHDGVGYIVVVDREDSVKVSVEATADRGR